MAKPAQALIKKKLIKIAPVFLKNCGVGVFCAQYQVQIGYN